MMRFAPMALRAKALLSVGMFYMDMSSMRGRRAGRKTGVSAVPARQCAESDDFAGSGSLKSTLNIEVAA
jgi:hypothetical protein